METQVLTLDAVERGTKVVRLTPNKTTTNSQSSSKGNSSRSIHALQTVSKSGGKGSKLRCSHCAQLHYISNCDSFKSKSMSVEGSS